MAWKTSRGTMMVNGKIQTYCGAEHCIISVKVNSSTFTCQVGDLAFNQDRKSTILNDGELRVDESDESDESGESPIAAKMITDGEIRRDWPYWK